MCFFRDGDEVAQVTQFHLPYLSNMDFELTIYFTRRSQKAMVWVIRRREPDAPVSRFLSGY